jgi:hypothetical protein
MANKQEFKDVMERKATRLWYVDAVGRTAGIVQYEAGYSPGKLRENRQSEEPIYVAFEGQQPQELSEVLDELRRYRANTVTKTDELVKEIEGINNRLDYHSEELTELLKPTKKWWQKLTRK